MVKCARHEPIVRTPAKMGFQAFSLRKIALVTRQDHHGASLLAISRVHIHLWKMATYTSLLRLSQSGHLPASPDDFSGFPLAAKKVQKREEYKNEYCETWGWIMIDGAERRHLSIYSARHPWASPETYHVYSSALPLAPNFNASQTVGTRFTCLQCRTIAMSMHHFPYSRVPL